MTKLRIQPTILGCVFLLFSASCHHDHEPHEHQDDQGAGEDHHAGGHGHGDTPTVGTTLWGDEFELFSEHSPGQVGKPVSFLVHLTKLVDFRALEEGSLTIEFEGPASLSGTTEKILRPGIFRVEVTPEKVGQYRGRVRITGPTPGVVEGIELEVFKTAEEAAASVSDEDDQGTIEFLKEQQWGVPFGTAFVESARVVPSIVVSGRIDTPPGGNAVVGAPVTGRLVSPVGGLPRPGSSVRKGQILTSLIPAPASPEAEARANLAVAEAQARLAAAGRDLERAERLIKDEAISQRTLEHARREKNVAQESVTAALRAAELYSGARGAAGQGTWHLTAPIAGTLVEVRATPGATVSPGTTLFRIIDTRELWVVARVPEQDATALRTGDDPSFKVAGHETWSPIKLTGEDSTGSVVTIGRTVDPVSRTVDAIYSLRAPGDALRVGGLVQVSLPVGESVQGATIPRSALIDQDGRSVVYVQADGEHFEERSVRTGPRAGHQVAIVEGLKLGERIVTRGAHLVRLVDQAGGETAHGHIH